jgi:hypothetical protein
LPRGEFSAADTAFSNTVFRRCEAARVERLVARNLELSVLVDRQSAAALDDLRSRRSAELLRLKTPLSTAASLQSPATGTAVSVATRESLRRFGTSLRPLLTIGFSGRGRLVFQ